jgi:26S proteasome regulatory subunit N10
MLEATILVVDNSEYARNGDYTPNRLDAQNDAVTLLFNAKTQSNPENMVGLMTMAGKGWARLCMLRRDAVLTPGTHATRSRQARGPRHAERRHWQDPHRAALDQDWRQCHSVDCHSDCAGAEKNASCVRPDLTRLFTFYCVQLALKHRQNKNQKQRIIVFVGSPVDEDEKSLVKLGKKLKKNNVAVDVVNFGEEAENTTKLDAFVQAVNSSDNRWDFLLGKGHGNRRLPSMFALSATSLTFLLALTSLATSF